MFQDLVLRARSHRRFDESNPITEGDLKRIVDVVRVAPCGGNQQKLRYRLVSDKAECDAIFPFIAWAGAMPDWPGPAKGEQPTGYIAICSQHDAKGDAAIAAVTMQYAATDMSYCACILGAIKRAEIGAALQLPEDCLLLLLVAFGTPGETIVIDEAHEGDSLKYYRTADEIHHVPKLGLDDVLIS